MLKPILAPTKVEPNIRIVTRNSLK